MPRWLITLLLTLSLFGLHTLTPAPAEAVWIIGYGDSLDIKVKDAGQYAIVAAVRPDGDITIPFVGDIPVMGLTPAQAGDRIARLLKAYLRDPVVSVVVASYRTRVVTLLGQVNTPGIKSLTPENQTVFDIIAQGGGFTPRAIKSQVMLIRGNGPKAERWTIDFDQMLKTGDFSADMPVKDGDKVQVPEVWYPNLSEIYGTLTTITGLIGGIVFLLSMYDRATK